MVGIGRLKSYHYILNIVKKRGFKRVGIEWGSGVNRSKKKKKGCALLQRLFWFLIYFQISFRCRPSSPPKNYTASSKELRRLLIGRLFDKRTMDGNTHALRVRRTCEQKRRRTSWYVFGVRKFFFHLARPTVQCFHPITQEGARSGQFG